MGLKKVLGVFPYHGVGFNTIQVYVMVGIHDVPAGPVVTHLRRWWRPVMPDTAFALPNQPVCIATSRDFQREPLGMLFAGTAAPFAVLRRETHATEPLPPSLSRVAPTHRTGPLFVVPLVG